MNKVVRWLTIAVDVCILLEAAIRRLKGAKQDDTERSNPSG
jgi:hypothetical protein